MTSDTACFMAAIASSDKGVETFIFVSSAISVDFNSFRSFPSLIIVSIDVHVSKDGVAIFLTSVTIAITPNFTCKA